jgi:hypothetical protein
MVIILLVEGVFPTAERRVCGWSPKNSSEQKGIRCCGPLKAHLSKKENSLIRPVHNRLRGSGRPRTYVTMPTESKRCTPTGNAPNCGVSGTRGGTEEHSLSWLCKKYRIL